MKSSADIKKLAREKFTDAECLFINGRFNSAYYLAGYCIELLIKAKICQTLGIEDFFDFSNPDKTRLKNEGSLLKPFKVHDLEQLLILSGIYSNLLNKTKTDAQLNAAWSEIVRWNENTRYEMVRTEGETMNLLTSVKKFEAWIKNFL